MIYTDNKDEFAIMENGLVSSRGHSNLTKGQAKDIYGDKGYSNFSTSDINLMTQKITDAKKVLDGKWSTYNKWVRYREANKKKLSALSCKWKNTGGSRTWLFPKNQNWTASSSSESVNWCNTYKDRYFKYKKLAISVAGEIRILEATKAKLEDDLKKASVTTSSAEKARQAAQKTAQEAAKTSREESSATLGKTKNILLFSVILIGIGVAGYFGVKKLRAK